jgi:hypothetical protein
MNKAPQRTSGAKLSAYGFGPTLSAQALNNQTHWLVIFGITGSICARALKPQIELGLEPRGHHDWPVMRVIRPMLRALVECASNFFERRFEIFPAATGGGWRGRESEPIRVSKTFAFSRIALAAWGDVIQCRGALTR